LPEKKRIFLRDETNGVEVLPQDVGIGISQVLPVIVVALHSNKGVVAIEQPELHIHPAFQVALGDLFISRVKEQDVCFLLETHSEHLLLRLLRRIRETHEDALPIDAPSLTPDLISVFYIEQSEKGMSITPLKVDETGEFTNRWPRGFFEERDEELF
jgi:predicted ATPase